MDYVLTSHLSLKSLLNKLFSMTDSIYLYMNPGYKSPVILVTKNDLDYIDNALLEKISCINVGGYLFFYNVAERYFYFPFTSRSLRKMKEPIFLSFSRTLGSPITIIKNSESMYSYLAKNNLFINREL